MEVRIQSIHFDASEKIEAFIQKKAGNTFVSSAFLSSLLSDSNQRPRDYKSRALAN